MQQSGGKVDGRRLLKAATYVGILVVGMAVVWFGFRIALGTQTPFFVVSSRSMLPTLQIGDIIVVQDGGTFQTLRVGDIIVFERPGTHEIVIVHRIYRVNEVDGERRIETKGDNNPSPDSWVVKEADYIGKVVFTIPQLGYLTTWLTPPLNYVIIAAILAVIFLTELYSKEKRNEPPAENARPPITV